MAGSVKNLVSQTAVYGVSAIVSKFLNYMLTPYLTRLMSDEVYGQMSLLYAIIPFANVLLTMGMATAYFRWFNKAESLDQKKTIFTTIWGGVSIFAILFFALSFLFRNQITFAMEYGQSWYWVVTAALIMVDNIVSIPLANLRAQGRAKMYTVINVSSVLINVVVCWALYTFVPNATGVAGWVVVANLVASTVTLVMLLPSARKLICKTFSPKLFKEVAKFSIPLMFAGLMGVGSEFLDRQMLMWLLPSDVAYSEVGIYSAVAKIAALMIIFRQVYTLGAEPFFLQNFAKDDFKRLNAQALKYFTIFGLWVVLGIVFFSDLFAIIVGQNFRIGMGVVPILLITNLLMGVLVNLSFWYKVVDKTRYAIFVTGAGLFTAIVASYLLIPNFGYYGAAYAHLSASVVMVVLSYVFNQVNYKVDYDLKTIFYFVALAGASWFLAEQVALLSTWGGYFVKILLLLIFFFEFLRKEKLFVKIKKIWKK